MTSAIFPTSYLPPVSFFKSLISTENVLLEKHEHYIKQTYRSRTLICTANGLHALIIPVQHESLYKKTVNEIKISYDSAWQKIHWRTITSSYRNSPYFEYFEDELRTFYDIKTETLFEFNLILLEKIFSLLKIPFDPDFTTSYQESLAGEIKDLRNAFDVSDRKKIPPYNQVFGERHGFIEDLSIIDLLCNKGMGAKEYLEKMSIEY